MNPRPRGRYKKKKRDLILYLKITLICYLAIFGVAYMSSDTSANFSSQSVLTGAITAGIWIPEIPAIACGMEDSTDEITGEESAPTSEVKATEATVVTVIDPVNGEEVEVDCGDLSDATEGQVETGKSKELECKKTEAPESTEQVTIDCIEEEKEEAAENAEVPAIEKEKEEEKAAEDIEAPAVDEEKAEKEEPAEEVKTPVTEKENEEKEKEKEKENAPENTETTAIEKEKEAKPQNESITEEKAVNKENGAKTGADESKESEVPKPNTESPIPPKSNDENKSDESSQMLKL